MGAPGSELTAASAPRRTAPAPRETISLKGTPLGGVTRVALSVETTSIRLMPGAIRVSMLASVDWALGRSAPLPSPSAAFHRQLRANFEIDRPAF
jgi:hypothetical protein